MIQAVIWDLGGVLLRTNDYASRDELASRHGMTREDLERLVFGEESGHQAQLGLIDVNQHWENVRHKLGLPAEELEAFRKSFWRGDQIDDELVAFIRRLKQDYRSGLLSNAFSNLRQVLHESWKIADIFDVIVISAEEGLVKPDARIYQLALDRLGVSPRNSIFIDDLPLNVAGARKLGMQAIQFQSTEQARSEVMKIIGEDHR